MARRPIRLALLLLAAATACACGSSAKTTIVPWVDRPLPLYIAPIPKPKPYPASAPACRARQLRVSQGRSGAGLGNDLEELVFRNVGPTCLLRGYPRVSGVDPTGVRRTLRPMRGGTYFGQLVAADMRRGGRTLLDFGTSRGCDSGAKPGTTYRDLIFRLPRGGVVRGGRNVTITEFCGLSTSAFGLPPRPLGDPTPRPGSPGSLTAAIAAPAIVPTRGTLRYVVTLVNRTHVTVTLSPCPGYTQSLYAAGLLTRGSFALDCDLVHAIPPGHRVRYAMRLRVPRRQTEAAKLAWSLNDSTGPFAAAVVQVTR